MTDPWRVLQRLVATDAAAPRMTFYERTPGPTAGERIELSAKVLLNWVSKAANLLAEEFDIEPGSHVAVVLPAAHWRTAYWCLAAGSLGATLAFVDADSASAAQDAARMSAGADVVVTSERSFVAADHSVVVTLAALARAADQPVPAGALDEAREISTFADVFQPHASASPDDIALVTPSGSSTFHELCAPGHAGRVYFAAPSPRDWVGTWSAGGSVVAVRGNANDLDHILRQESAERR